MKSRTPVEKLVPYETIVSATQGDLDALQEVHKHFAGYIAFMSTRIFRDGYGQTFLCVDPELKRRIENKLTARIIQHFDPSYTEQ